MKVRVLKSFGGVNFRASSGDIIELPEGVDWLRAGLVEPFIEEPEAAAIEPAETATMPKPRKRRTTRKATTE